MILDKVNSPKDLKTLSIEEMQTLANEMRELIIKKVNVTSGHLGPNLGIAEATIAMHYVFNSPEDKFVFDVSHQCYPHKMITGRKEGFLNPDKYFEITGYTAPEETPHDLFKVGHTSTSVSLATGVAKARDLLNKNYNVVALIGDGSLTGGEALEGLNNASALGSNIIIVVNDNEMSIAENHGGIYSNLRELRESNGQCQNNFFKTMGFDYFYEANGNDVQSMINIFNKVKDTNRPTIVHIHTIKGKGYDKAVADKEFYHWVNPGYLEADKNNAVATDNTETYTSLTKDFLLEKAKQDSSVVVVNPATPGVFGFDKTYRNELGKQYVDVGIAEEHAVAFCSAIAKTGAKPFLNIMSSFVQRAYDQISQDACLNNSPMTMLVHWGSISGADATHLCVFDIPFLSNIPNMVYLAPTNKEEYVAMLEYAYKQNEHTVAIRVPFTQLISTGIKDGTDYSILNKFKIEQNGNTVAIVGVGNMLQLAKETAQELKTQLGCNATVINPRFLTGIDKDLLDNLKQNHTVVITLEDGVLNGGFGEKIASYYGNSDMKVLNYGAEKLFTDRVPVDKLYEQFRLTKEQICEDVKNILK